MPMRRSKPFPRTLIRAPVAVRFFVGFTESVVSPLLVTLVGTDAALTEVVLAGITNATHTSGVRAARIRPVDLFT